MQKFINKYIESIIDKWIWNIGYRIWWKGNAIKASKCNYFSFFIQKIEIASAREKYIYFLGNAKWESERNEKLAKVADWKMKNESAGKAKCLF